jgi:plasmid maintenance system antidote protein VapI
MHPGELMREEILPALGRSRIEIARLLGVSRQALTPFLPSARR